MITTMTSDGKQFLILIRHGDRYDYAHPKWRETSTRPDDPPLSKLGFQQAAETGIFLNSFLSNENIVPGDITWLSSPFLRCLQTSHIAMDELEHINGNTDEIQILPEYSIFEWDGHNGKFHKSLPDLTERKHYFPRLDHTYQSMFIPTLPEPRAEFQTRCHKAATSMNQRFPYRPKSIIVAVTHAAGCIGLAAALANMSISDITPAAPCSIYLLSRLDNSKHWMMDPHDMEHSMNGYTGHISDLGGSTTPWNNFGTDKTIFHGYTGPANSRFAPIGYTNGTYIKSDHTNNDNEL